MLDDGAKERKRKGIKHKKELGALIHHAAGFFCILFNVCEEIFYWNIIKIFMETVAPP